MKRRVELVVVGVVLAGLLAAPAAEAVVITGVAVTGGTAPETPIVVPGGLAEDALAFVDRTHEWNSVPSWLVGADYVQLANDDKNVGSYQLDVQIAEPAALYLFYDNRYSPPAWVAASGFMDTGADIGVDESGDGDIDQTSSVFARPVSTGTTTLGANSNTGNMYGVAALPKADAPDFHTWFRPLVPGTYLEDTDAASNPIGRFVIEGEHQSSRQSGADDWLVVPDEDSGAGPAVANPRAGRYVQCLPDDQSPGGPTVPPSSEYQIQVTTPGQYQLYLRWEGNNTNGTTRGQSDSIFVDIVELKDGTGGTIADWYELQQGLDGNFATSAWDAGGGFEQNTATPANNPIVWDIPAPGVYTVRVSQREDGSAVDSIVFQLASLPAPSGFGPGESEFSPFTPTITRGYSKSGGDTDAAFPTYHVGGFVEGAPAYVDAQGVWTNIPAVLLGADYIRTENDDTGPEAVEYALRSFQDAFLYLLVDDRYLLGQGVPQWMDDLGLLDSDFDVLQDGQPFSILYGNLPAGDIVSLLGLGDTSASFYGIVISDQNIIPEPATLSLLGLGALALLRRRRS